MATSQDRYTAQQLAAAVGITLRTLRWWIAVGVVPRPANRGRPFVYGEQHLLRARATNALRQRKTSLQAVRRQLASADAEQLAALARVGTPASTAPIALPRPLAPPSYPHERWHRVALLPGLELHVREDASGALRRVADEIYKHYGAAEA